MDRRICHCNLCGARGQEVSRSTYNRHSNRADTRSVFPPPSPPLTTPLIPVDVVAGGDHTDPPSLDTSHDPTPGSRTPQFDTITHVRHMLTQKRAHFDFPPSLVFITPPTKDSDRYASRNGSQLLVPNSYHPLSLVDDDSVAVVSYELFLVEYLNVLNMVPLQEGHASASEVESLKNEVLDTLQQLDQRKGNEWNKQLCAQLNPSTFIISGEDQRAPWL